MSIHSRIEPGFVFFGTAYRPDIACDDLHVASKAVEFINWLNPEDFILPTGYKVKGVEASSQFKLGAFICLSVSERQVVALPIIKVPFGTGQFARSCDVADRAVNTFLAVYPADNEVKLPNDPKNLDQKFRQLVPCGLPVIKALPTRERFSKKDKVEVIEHDIYVDLVSPTTIPAKMIAWSDPMWTLPSKEVNHLHAAYCHVNSLMLDSQAEKDNKFLIPEEYQSSPRPTHLIGNPMETLMNFSGKNTQPENKFFPHHDAKPCGNNKKGSPPAYGRQQPHHQKQHHQQQQQQRYGNKGPNNDDNANSWQVVSHTKGKPTPAKNVVHGQSSFQNTSKSPSRSKLASRRGGMTSSGPSAANQTASKAIEQMPSSTQELKASDNKESTVVSSTPKPNNYKRDYANRDNYVDHFDYSFHHGDEAFELEQESMLNEPWPADWIMAPQGEHLIEGLKGMSIRNSGWDIPQSNMPPNEIVENWLDIATKESVRNGWELPEHPAISCA